MRQWECHLLILTPKFQLTHMHLNLGVPFCPSIPDWQRSWYISVLVNLCVSNSCGCAAFLLCHSSDDPEPPAPDTQGFYFCQTPVQNAAVQHRVECAGQEVRYRTKQSILVHFQNKNLWIYSRSYFAIQLAGVNFTYILYSKDTRLPKIYI